VTAWCVATGVEVVLGQRAEAVTPEAPGTTGPGVYKINDKERSFDMVFKCVGFKTAHGSFIGPLGAVTTANGAVDVNSSLQVRALRPVACAYLHLRSLWVAFPVVRS
jgi:hypothetical protein